MAYTSKQWMNSALVNYNPLIQDTNESFQTRTVQNRRESKHVQFKSKHVQFKTQMNYNPLIQDKVICESDDDSYIPKRQRKRRKVIYDTDEDKKIEHKKAKKITEIAKTNIISDKKKELHSNPTANKRDDLETIHKQRQQTLTELWQNPTRNPITKCNEKSNNKMQCPIDKIPMVMQDNYWQCACGFMWPAV
eukprot:114213_1